MKHARPTPLAIILALVCFVVAFAAAGDRKFEKKFTVAPGETFTLNTDVGSIAIVGTAANEVAIEAQIRGRGRDVDEFEIIANQVEKGVEVKGRGRSSGWWFWNTNDLEVRFTVRVPREYNIRLNTSGGDVGIATIKGRVQGETSGGNIDVKDVEGEVDMGTSGGNIRSEKITGNVRMETSGGDIVLTTINGDVEAGTSGGNIRISDVDGKVRAETSGGDVMVRVKNGNKGVYAETSGGDIEIMMDKNIAATIDASTSGGEVSCDLPITMSGRIDESRIRGSVNGGGNPIHAHTSGGDVRIKAAN